MSMELKIIFTYCVQKPVLFRLLCPVAYHLNIKSHSKKLQVWFLGEKCLPTSWNLLKILFNAMNILT